MTAIFLVLTIASSVGIWIVYNQINQAPDLTNNVRISNFNWRSGIDSSPGWEGIILRNNVSGLTLTAKVVYNENEVIHSEGFSKNIDVLPAGETLKISEYVYSYVSFRPEGAECVSTLLQGKTVLDNRTDPITWD